MRGEKEKCTQKSKMNFDKTEWFRENTFWEQFASITPGVAYKIISSVPSSCMAFSRQFVVTSLLVLVTDYMYVTRNGLTVAK